MYPASTLEKWKAALLRLEALDSETRAHEAALQRTLKRRRLYVGRSGGEWEGRVCKRHNGGDVLLVSINEIEPILWFKHYGELGHNKGRDGTLHAIRSSFEGIPRRLSKPTKIAVSCARQTSAKRRMRESPPSSQSIDGRGTKSISLTWVNSPARWMTIPGGGTVRSLTGTSFMCVITLPGGAVSFH